MEFPKFGSGAEKGPKQEGQKHLREMLFLAEQAKEGTMKVLPGKEWGYHYPVSAERRKEILEQVLEGKIDPSVADRDLRPDALIYDVKDLETQGLEGVSSRILEESSTVAHYDYRKFAEFVAQMKGSEVTIEECERFYQGITKTRTQKKLRDAYGTTGQRQMDAVLERDAQDTVKNIGKQPRIEKVLQTLKLDWLCENRKQISAEQRDQALAQLSGDERDLFNKLSESYRKYIDAGDTEGYKKLIETVRQDVPKITKQKKDDAPSESMQELEKELEQYEEEVGKPGSEKDPGIPPEDSDEYHTPDAPDQESAEKGEAQIIFEITPPLGGFYASGRKSYYDIATKTWSKRKQLAAYSDSIAGTDRHTIGGMTVAGTKSLPIPVNYALDFSSLKFQGAEPKFHRDQNGCFYIISNGTSQFSIDFTKESLPFPGKTIAEDVTPLYHGSLSDKTEKTLKHLSGGPLQKAEQARQYLLANHFYPGGGDLTKAQALQAKLRKENTGEKYIQALDASEYLECYSANTLFAAIMRKAGVPARLVVGDRVTGVKDGKSMITTGTGHAWSEIWEGKAWIRVDATPSPKPEDMKDEDKNKDEGEDGGEGEGESGEGGDASEAQDGGKESPQDEQKKQDQKEQQEGKPSKEQSDQSGQPGEQMGETDDAAVEQGEEDLKKAEEKMDQMNQEKEQLEQKTEKAQSFKEIEDLKKEAEQADLLEDMKKEIEDKLEAKEEHMKEEIKDQLDKMVQGGFLDEEKRNELEKMLEEKNQEALDKLKEEIAEESALYNSYEDIKSEIMPLVEEWFKYFAERLPREDSVELDEDSLSRQGSFNRRSVNRARNIIFGTVKNPRIIRSSVKPLFMASILIDVSGSMQGTKLENARKLLIFYSELFTRISDEFGYIRFSINTFSDSINEIKAFDQDYDSPQRYSFGDGSASTIKVRLMKKVEVGGGTNMLGPIKKAAADLNQETHDHPDYASAFYFVGDGEDTSGNSANITQFMELNDAVHGFGDHMRSAIMLGGETEKRVLSGIFGDDHTTVAGDLDELIEQSMFRFDEDIESYLRLKTK